MIVLNWIKNHHHRWREQTGDRGWQVCLQGLRLGAVIWLLFLTARTLSYMLVFGWGRTLFSPGLVTLLLFAYLVVLLALTRFGPPEGRTSSSNAWLRLGALLAVMGLFGAGLYQASGYTGPWNWHHALTMALPSCAPLLFLALPCRKNEGNRIKRAILPIVLVLFLLPLAYFYELHPFTPGSSFKLIVFLVSGGAFALMGLLDPRLWFAVPILAMNSALHYALQNAALTNALQILLSGVLLVLGPFVLAWLVTAIYLWGIKRLKSS